ncbi:MAG: GNAT family N-acetyltransferase [Aquabacterium sp.]|uniref:GNAT family N-acetyltransferase n=1 Tax=Aquabacterium sp. TaxID=1872578 RepID=UPI003BAE8B52
MNLHLLRAALGHFVGQELTPTVAARIEFIAMGGEDLCRPPEQFAPLDVDGFTIQVERLRDILDELHGLHELHWQETEKHRHGLPLCPDYGQMKLLERQGRLVQFTVRRDGVLVGNLRMYVGMSMHSSTPFGEPQPTSDEDTLFIHPDHRGSWLSIKLLRYAEAVLVGQLGVREIRADSKLVNRADVLMRRLGYREFATRFVKVFPRKEPSHVLGQP